MWLSFKKGCSITNYIINKYLSNIKQNTQQQLIQFKYPVLTTILLTKVGIQIGLSQKLILLILVFC